VLDAEQRQMRQLEDSYWWFAARRRLILALAQRVPLAVPEPLVILDVGCGTGATLEALSERGRAIGCDPSSVALTLSRERGLRLLVQATGERLPFRRASVDLIVASDVLEHVEDDSAALREMLRVLKPEGRAIISVPACQFLWTRRDEALHHLRRYSARELRSKLTAAGLALEYQTHVLWLLFPVVAVVRLVQRLQQRLFPSREPPQVDIPPAPGPLNTLLVLLHDFENWLACRLPLPWGVTLVVVTRPGGPV